MNITCPACSAQFAVHSSRVPAEGLSVQCTHCAHSFRYAPQDDELTLAMPAPAGRLQGGQTNTRYFVKRSTGKVFGPFDANAIRIMLGAGKLDPDAQVSPDQVRWQPLSEVPAFSDLSPAAPMAPPARPSFGRPDPGPGGTMLGAWSGGEMEELDLDIHLEPLDEEDKGEAPMYAPRLPRLGDASGFDTPAELPQPRDFSLPRPAQPGADLPRPAAPKFGAPAELPAPRTGLPTPGFDLPRPRAELPAPSFGLPAQRDDLPLPKAELPAPSFGLPAQRDNLPAPRPAPLPANPLDGLSQKSEHDGLFAPRTPPADDVLFRSAGLPPQEDLFSAPDDEDLFSAPNTASTSADYDDFDMGAAMPASAFTRNEPPRSAPARSRSEDLFAAPEDDEEDDLFAAPFAGGSNTDLLQIAPSDYEAATGLDADADFLAAGNNFSFLEEPPQPQRQSPAGDLAGMSGEWGDDLMSNAPPQDDFGAPSPMAPRPAETWGSTPAQSAGFGAQASPGGRRADSAHAPDTQSASTQPASRGVSAQTTHKQAVAEDKKRGTMMLVGVPLLLLAVLGGVGYGLYATFFTPETTPEQPVQTVTRGPATLDLAQARGDTFGELRALVDAGRNAQLSEVDSARLLMLEALVLSRYEDPELAKDAQTRAAPLSQASSGWPAMARGAFEAQQGNADAARAYLEPLLGEDEALTFWAQLFMGIGDTLAMEKHLGPIGALPADVPLAPPADDATPAPASPDEQPTQPGDEAADPAAPGDEAQPAEDDAAPAAPALDDTARRLRARAFAALDGAKRGRADWPVVEYWRARLYARALQPDKAIRTLDALLKAHPEHVASLVEIAQAHYDRGDLNSAVAPLEAVTEDLQSKASSSERATAYHLLGMIHAARQQREEAIKALTTALSIDAGRSDTIQALAEQYMSAEKYQEALNFFTTNKNLGAENPDVMLGIVRAYMGLEKWDEAITQLQRGSELFPGDARFPLYLGRLHRDRAAFFDAKQALSQAIDIDARLLSAHAALAQLIWLTDKDLEQADKHIAPIEASTRRIDPQVGTEVARFYQMSARPQLAEKWFEKTLTLYPSFWPARLSLARMYLDAGQNKKALKLLERSKKEGVQDLRLSAYLADAYRQSREFSKAVDQINAVIATNPDNEEYIFIRGRIYLDQGNFDNARQDFNKAYELNPRFYDAYFYLGRAEFAQGDFTKALKIFRHVLDYRPNSGEFRYWMGRAYEEEGRLTSALAEYRKVTVVDLDYAQKNPQIYVRRAQILIQQGYSDQAKQDISEALRLRPDMPEALVAMGELYYREKQYDEAIDKLSRAAKNNPEQPNVQYKLGMALMYTNQEVKGAEHLQLAVRYGYEDPKVFQTLGYLYKRMNRRDAAVESFKTYLARIAQDKSTSAEAKREMLRQIEELGGRL